jgi:hypothetical protein
MATKRVSQTLLASAILLALVAPTQAAPIPIFNTGVDAAGVSQADNAAELHYLAIAPSVVTGVPIVATSTGGFPIPPWIADSTISAWIGPSMSTFGPVGTYIIRTTFDLTGLDETTAMLAGRWSTDNNGLDILINGTGTGHTTAFAGFGTWSPFSIMSGFTSGINTLDFVAINGGGPAGLRVEFEVAKADIKGVPEPASLALLGIGLAGLGAMRRRKA